MQVLINRELEILANVYELESKKVIVEWKGDVKSIVIHDNMENFRKISVDNNVDRLCVERALFFEIQHKTLNFLDFLVKTVETEEAKEAEEANKTI